MIKTNQKLTIYNENDQKEIEELAQKVTKERAIRLINELSKLENDMKSSTQRLIVFQAGIIRLCDKEIITQENTINNNSGNSQDIYARLDKIENYLRNTGRTTTARAVSAPRTQNSTKETAPKPDNTAIEGIGKNSKPAQYWKEIVNNLKKNGKLMLYTNLLNTNAVEINDLTVGIEFPAGLTPFGKTVLEKPENKMEIAQQISLACGKQMQVKYIDTKPQEQELNEEQELSNFASGFDIPFDITE